MNPKLNKYLSDEIDDLDQFYKEYADDTYIDESALPTQTYF